MAKKKKSWEEIQKLANENGSKNQNTQNIMQSTRGTQPNIFSNMQPVQPKQVNLLEQNQRNMSTWDKVVNNMAYTGATFGNELGGGLINTAQMTNADTLNYAQRKGNQGVVKAATDFLSNYANPIQNGVPGFNLNDPVGSLKDILKTGERYNNIINSDAPFGEKLASLVGETLTNVKEQLPGFSNIMKASNVGFEVASAITGKDKNQIIESLSQENRKLSKGYEQRRDNLGQDQSVGGVTKTVANVGGQIARMLPSIGLNQLAPGTGVGLLQMGQSAGGSKLNERLDQGDSLSQAVNRANITEATEIGTEMMFKGANKLASGTVAKLPGAKKITKGAKKWVENNVKSKLSKKVLNLIKDAAGENIEEIVSDYTDYIVSKAYGEDAEFGLNTEKETMLYTTLTELTLGILFDGMVGINTRGNKKVVNNSNLDTMTKENLTKFVEDNSITRDGATALVNGINNIENKTEINKLLKSGKLQEVVDYIGNARQTERENIINSSDLSDEEKASLLRVVQAKNIPGEQVQRAIDNKLDEDTRRTLFNNLNVVEDEQGNRTYFEKQATKIENNDNLKSTYKKYYGNNKTALYRNLDNIESIGKEIGARTIFDGNEFKVTKEEAAANPNLKEGAIKTNVEAFFRTRDGKTEIVINPYADTKKSFERIFSHELTHGVLGTNTEEANRLKKTVEEFWKKQYGEEKYNDMVKDLKAAYGKNFNDEELTAKTIEQLFTRQEDLNTLANSNPNIFTRIYRNLVSIYAKLTGSEKAYVKKIKLDMELAWSKSKNKDSLQDASNKFSQQTSLDNKLELSTQDSQGRTLSKQQQEYFKDSKVRDENGNLLEVYHGTKTEGINIFEYNPNRQTGTDYGKAYYFTSDYTKAQGYQYDIENDPLYKEYDKKDKEYKNWVFEEGISEDERSKRIKKWSKWHEENNVFDILNNEEFTPERMPKGETKKVYLNLTNPYIADANGEYYSKVYDRYFKEARENGNDGIIVKNVIDVARGEHRPIDVYIAFNENQIKNIDNTKPTENPDIRYSQTTNLDKKLTIDNNGRKLSKGQKEYFKDTKVRDENGNLLEVYHGTPNGGFTIFNRNKISKKSVTHQWGYGFYFSNNSKVGDEYTRAYNNTTGEYGTSENPQKYAVYLNIKNPLVLSDTYSGQEGHDLDREKLKELILKGDSNHFFDSWIPFSTGTINELNYKLDGLNEEQIKNLSKEEKVDYWLRQEYDEKGIKNILQEMGRAYNNVSDLIDNFQKILGYDGIIVNGRNNTNQYIAFNPEQIKSIDNTKPTTNPDIRYSINTEFDNVGNKLSLGQRKYFNGSKAVDENGNLVKVYHTTGGYSNIAQFNTFDPRIDNHYHFGNQIVNYYTDDQHMSGSYADQKYKAANTKTINSMEEVNNYLKGLGEYEVNKRDDGTYEVKQINGNDEFANELEELDKNDPDTYDQLMYKVMTEGIKSGYNLFGISKKLDNFLYELDNKYGEYTAGETARELIDYINNMYGEGAIFENETDLYRNLVEKVQKKYPKGKTGAWQYQGYVNLQNPYIIDAEGRAWNKIKIEEGNVSKALNELDSKTKKELTKIAKESLDRYNQAKFDYRKIEDAIYYMSSEPGNYGISKLAGDLSKLVLNTRSWNYLDKFLKQKGDKYEVWRANAEMSNIINDMGLWTPEERIKYHETAKMSQRVIDNINTLLNEEVDDGSGRTVLQMFKELSKAAKKRYEYDDENSYIRNKLADGRNDKYSSFYNYLWDEEIYRLNLTKFREIAENGFDKEEIRVRTGKTKETNDIVKEVLAKNSDLFGDGEENWRDNNYTQEEILSLGGYDGVIIKNTLDYGGNYDKDKKAPHDLYITFGSDQFKAADNKNPTNDPDIRYSINTDTLGRELSEGQRKFFANEDTKLLDKNGNLKVLYHGTPYGKFYEFNDKNMYFLTEDYQFAEDYANQKSFEQELDGEANVMEVYAKAEKVFDPSDKNDIEALRKVLPDKLQYWAREFDKETALQRIQRKDVLPPKWTKEQIDKAEFGRVIGEDRYGYNNDLFIGVNDNNEVVYTTHDNYRAFEHMTEKEKQDVKSKLMNGETVYFDYYGTPFGYMSYNALVDKINEYKQNGHENDAKYLQETKDAIDNNQTWKYQELSDKIKPYTDSLNETELEDIDNWSYIEGLFDRESGKDVFQYIKDLGYDAINIFEKGKSNYVVFNKNQIKDVTNQNPTENPDIRYSKGTQGDWTEYLTKYSKGGTKTYLPQISGKLPTRKITNQDFLDVISSKTNLPQEEIDSARNIINQINKTEESLRDFDKQLTTLDNMYAETNQEEQQAPKSMEDLFDEVGGNEVESPLKDRNIETIGKETKTNAYQYENPEVKPFFQEMAQRIGEDLSYVSDKMNRRTVKGGGTKLHTNTKALNDLHNKFGYSYEQIANGLNDIIEDHGSENNAVSKKIEFYIDEALRNGYRNSLGQFVEPNQGYIDTISYSMNIDQNNEDESWTPEQIEEDNQKRTNALKQAYRELQDIYNQSKDVEFLQSKYNELEKLETTTNNEYDREKYRAMQSDIYGVIHGRASLLEDAGIQDFMKEGQQPELPRPQVPTAKNTQLPYNPTTDEDLQAIRDNSILAQEPEITPERVEEGVEKDTLSYLVEGRTKTKMKNLKDEFMQKFINKGHYVDKLAKATKNKQLTYKYDRMLTSFAEAQVCIGDEQVIRENGENKVVGKSLNDIYKPAVDAKLLPQFEDYLLNRHNIDRFAYEKGVYGTEVSSKDSQKNVAKYEEIYPEFKEWAKDVYAYNRNSIQELVNEGLISQEFYDKLISMYGSYVPTFRDIQEMHEELVGEGSVGHNVIKKATGSRKPIISPRLAMAEQTIAFKKAIATNEVGKELYKSLGKKSKIFEGLNFDNVAIESLGGNVVEKGKDGNNTFMIFNKGEATQFKISDDLYSAFNKDTIFKKINNNELASALLTPIEKLTKAQRNLLTTYSVGFAFNNPIKDYQDALYNTKYTAPEFAKNYTVALHEIATNGKFLQEAKRNGLGANTYYDFNKGILPETKSKLKKVGNKVMQVNEVIELAPRLAEYITTREHGGTIDEALYNAAEITTNFKRGGDITKFINKYGANFVNASVQGLDKQIRNITENNSPKGYARLIFRAVTLGVLPAVINHLLLDDDDDYQDLPDYIKDSYYLLPSKTEGQFYRIPKGRVLAVLGATARRTIEAFQGEGLDAYDNYIKEVWINNLAPNNPLTDNLISPIVQAAKNNAWYDGEIVSTRLQKKPKAEQSDERTNKFSKFVGESLGKLPQGVRDFAEDLPLGVGTLFKIAESPKLLNYVLDQYSGGVGDVVLPHLTPFAEDSMLANKFTTNAILKNKNVEAFYEALENAETMNNSDYATDSDKLAYKYLSGVSKDVGSLYSDKREIQSDSTLKDKEKKAKTLEIQKEINNKVEEALKKLNEMKLDNDYASFDGTEYYKNEKGEWKEIDSEDVATGLSNQTYSDYKNKSQKALSEKKKRENKDNAQLTDKERISLVLSSSYTNKEKDLIYDNYIRNDSDKDYAAYKILNGVDGIDNYLNYKSADFTSDKVDDGTVNGKAVKTSDPGSKKSKIINYIENSDFDSLTKLYLYGTNYKLSKAERKEFDNMLNQKNLTPEQKKQIYLTLNGVVEMKDGSIQWK